jgi:hypothetical protein
MSKAVLTLHRFLGTSLIAKAFILALSLPAWGQGLQCATRPVMVAKLLADYGEVPVASGLQSNGGLVEILTSPSGTWSIIVGRPGGPVCLVSSGESWQAVLPGRDS